MSVTVIGDVVSALFALAIPFVFMMIGTYRMRERIGKRWVSVLCCALALTVFAGLAIVFAYLSYQSAAFSERLRNPRPIPKLALDWGSNFAPEHRTKHSQTMAQMSFIERGESAKYFDLTGKLVDFEPTAEDDQRRAQYLNLIEVTKSRSWWFATGTALMLVLSALAVLAARTRFATWLYNLEGRLEEWRRRT